MNKKDAGRTPANRIATRLHVGMVTMLHNPISFLLVICYILLVVAAGIYLNRPDACSTASNLTAQINRAMFPVYAIVGLLALVIAFGYPRGARSAAKALARAGVTNSAGEAPMLLTVQRDRDNRKLYRYEFDANDLPLSYWQEHQGEVEAALNVCVVNMKCSRGKHRIWIFCVPASEGIPDYVELTNADIPEKESVLALGEGLIGQIIVDLNKTAHILIAGNSGSGKTVLLRILLWQAIAKGYQVNIADLKGGIDFSMWWHNHATVTYDEASVLNMLQSVVAELKRRISLLKASGSNNITQYNAKSGEHLPRIIIAFDEIAEALDKTGADRNRKEYIAQIEQCLATISRLGRACGIHLIVGVQRPDVNAVPAQIKTNLSYRCCSRADNVLSMIALDNTSAAEQIAKDSQGRFIDNEGRIFQAYYMKEVSYEQ